MTPSQSSGRHEFCSWRASGAQQQQHKLPVQRPALQPQTLVKPAPSQSAWLPRRRCRSFSARGAGGAGLRSPVPAPALVGCTLVLSCSTRRLAWPLREPGRMQAGLHSNMQQRHAISNSHAGSRTACRQPRSYYQLCLLLQPHPHRAPFTSSSSSRPCHLHAAPAPARHPARCVVARGILDAYRREQAAKSGGLLSSIVAQLPQQSPLEQVSRVTR